MTPSSVSSAATACRFIESGKLAKTKAALLSSDVEMTCFLRTLLSCPVQLGATCRIKIMLNRVKKLESLVFATNLDDIPQVGL